MLKYGDLFFFPNFVEVIHVELPDKRRKLAMFEVLGQYLFGEFILVFDNEAVALVSPLHNIAIPFILILKLSYL